MEYRKAEIMGRGMKEGSRMGRFDSPMRCALAHLLSFSRSVRLLVVIGCSWPGYLTSA